MFIVDILNTFKTKLFVLAKGSLANFRSTLPLLSARVDDATCPAHSLLSYPWLRMGS